MRLWSRNILPYLPDRQFKGQLREVVLIMRTWRDNGKTNHLLINKVMEYSKEDLYWYFNTYELNYYKRFGKFLPKYDDEFCDFVGCLHRQLLTYVPYQDWLETKEHLRIEMANLYEKHYHAKGDSRITDQEWQRLLDGYKKITGEDYTI